MPIFKFTQREVITHELIVKADSEEAADMFIGELGDDFGTSDTDWEQGELKEIQDGPNVRVDEDLTDE